MSRCSCVDRITLSVEMPTTAVAANEPTARDKLGIFDHEDVGDEHCEGARARRREQFFGVLEYDGEADSRQCCCDCLFEEKAAVG